MDSTNNPSTKHHPQPSNSELLSDAKVVAAAAKSSFGQGASEVDKAKAAHSAENILDAASRYGKLDEKSGLGLYVDKAENYLHQYESSSSSHSTTTTAAAPATGESQTKPSTLSTGGDEKSGSGGGDYLKMAQGFLKKDEGSETKSSDGGDGKSGGQSGGGDYMKMAQGLFK